MDAAKILVVDDEEVVLESCRRALVAHGYSVMTAANVDAAVELLKQETFDFAIIDLVMPGKSGMTLLRMIKESFPNMVVVMITGYSSINSAVESMKLGASDYLAKPFTPYELVVTVKNALEKKGIIRPPCLPSKPLSDVMIFENIIGRGPKMIEIFKIISKIAATDTNVLITGESGTGKEMVARAIHKNSLRKDRNFVVVDCLSLSPTLLESEIFGHVKGSFTGAMNNKAGFFQVADGGTLFLDEIGDLSFELQGKLLRVIQEHKYIPVGGTDEKSTNIRLIAATNKNLEKMVLTGQFREDLFYRLYVVPIHMPSLRDRKEDIEPLVEFFMERLKEKYIKPQMLFTHKALDLFMIYDWPGNVRELENTIERAFVNCERDMITADDLSPALRELVNPADEPSLATIEELKNEAKKMRRKAVEDIERKFVLEALEANDWKVSRAARAVGMQRTNFYRLMKKNDIHTPGSEEE